MKHSLKALMAMIAIQASHAGNPWTEINSGPIQGAAVANENFVLVGTEILAYGSGDAWFTAENPEPGASYAGVVFHASKGLAVGTLGELVASEDAGQTWRSLSLALPAVGFQDMATDPQGGFLVLNAEGQLFQVSEDLDTLTPQTVASAETLRRIVVSPQGVWVLSHRGKRYVRQSSGAWEAAGEIFLQPPTDSISLSFARYLPSGYWVGGSQVSCSGFVGCVTQRGVVRHSTDGINWVDTLDMPRSESVHTSTGLELAFGDVVEVADSLVMVIAGYANEQGALVGSYIVALRPTAPPEWSVFRARSSLRTGVTGGEETLLIGNDGLVLTNGIESVTQNKNTRGILAEVVWRWDGQTLRGTGSAGAVQGGIPMELVSFLGQRIALEGTVSQGQLSVSIPADLRNRPWILRSRDGQYPIAPIVIH